MSAAAHARRRVRPAAIAAAALLPGILGALPPAALAEGCCPSQLRWLARNQQPDGSWGDPESPPADRVRLTGMALLNFLGAGYTYLSRDVYDGIRFGNVVKGGIQRLMACQDPEGRLAPADRDVETHAWAAFALCEAYGLTRSGLFKENAALSVAWLEKRQRPDGGWGGEQDSDPLVTACAVAVLISAKTGGLPVSETRSEKAAAALERLASRDLSPAASAAVVAVALLRKHPKNDPAQHVRIDAIARGLQDPASADPHFRFWGLLALMQYDGPAGPLYTSCCHGVKDVLVRSQIQLAVPDVFGSWRPPDAEASKPVAMSPELRRHAEALIGALADPAWEKRERATTDLLQLGRDALPLLQDAAARDDPEVAFRATRVTRDLEAMGGNALRRIETTCLNGLTLLVYYRYDNVFGMPR